jgi:hypothetical protein
MEADYETDCDPGDEFLFPVPRERCAWCTREDTKLIITDAYEYYVVCVCMNRVAGTFDTPEAAVEAWDLAMGRYNHL